jgi:hypothetical protein
MLSGVKSLDGGIAFHRGMEMSFDVGTTSVQSAGALAVLMQGAVASPQVKSILRDLAVRADGTRVNLSASLDVAQLETGVKAMFAGSMQGHRGLLDWVTQGSQPTSQVAVAVTPKVTQPPAPPPQRKTIRIVGLDEGTREIAYPAGVR